MFEGTQEKHDPFLAAPNPKALPTAVKMGIAPAMKANPATPFWEGDMHEVLTKTQKKTIGRMPDWVHQPFIALTGTDGSCIAKHRSVLSGWGFVIFSFGCMSDSERTVC